MPAFTLSALMALLLAGLAPGAGAATVSEPLLPVPALGPGELQACLAQREHIARAEGELEARQAELARDRSEIEQLSTALDERLGTLDREDPRAVAAFHEEMMQRDRRVLAHVDRLPVFHAHVEAVKAEEAAWTARCADRPYEAADEARILHRR
ncbi:hypothetical protein [Caldimonas tepidiphila]|uniref:hypothetical protein n=1 Tax=Caldimonas tepidiphila TaxID=2315841 RepID=UPI000E5AE5C8|nr:hypothetical protein [Caldimonas tepidiphila]